MSDVFLSYSSADVVVVEGIEIALRQARLDVWRDKSRLRAGQQFGPEIQAALDQARCVVACLSPDAIASRWVEAECESARGKVIPVIIASYANSVQTRALFGQLHVRDMRAWCAGSSSDGVVFNELLADINAMLGRPVTTAPSPRAAPAAPAAPKERPRVNVVVNRDVGVAINFVQDQGRVDVHTDKARGD